MKLKRKKCVFHQESILFLGHRVAQGKVLVDDEKLGRLREWVPLFRDIRRVRQFLGFVSYYRAFIPHFAEVTAPLTELLQKSKQWKWTEEATKAVEEGKKALIEARARYAWDPERED